MNILENKVIVIIGASSGIGYATAEYFAKKGAKLCICARREEKLMELSDRMNALGKNVMYRKCDATNMSDLEKVCNDVVEKNGAIDLWINCAGFNDAIGNVWELDFEKDIWSEVNTNLKTCMMGSQVALKAMTAKNHGILLNFCGGGTTNPPPYIAAYATSKTAIARFTECCAMELELGGYDKVKVFCTNPGLVHTQRNEELSTMDKGKKYLSGMGEAFQTGNHQSPLNTAHLMEYALAGAFDNSNGQLLYGSLADKMDEKADDNNFHAGQILRLIQG